MRVAKLAQRKREHEVWVGASVRRRSIQAGRAAEDIPGCGGILQAAAEGLS